MNSIAAEARTSSLSDFLELTKPRITTLVVATTFVGFYMGSFGSIDYLLLFHTLLGTALVASGASALNMVLEWDADSRMRRTSNRPIPAHRLSVAQAGTFGSAASLIGILYLFIFVNPLTSILAIITSALYLFVYTPLKRKSPLCTFIGAIPGAIPPMMGWTAAQNSLGYLGWWLFTILFLWQIPHFLAIAILYKDDYERGGFPMLPVVDEHKTNRHIIVQSSSLLIVSVLPALAGIFSKEYLAGAVILGLIFLVMGIRVTRKKTSSAARQLLLTSVIYLPLLFLLVIFANVR